MPQSSCESTQLTVRLAKVIAGARVCLTPLPQVAEITLYLLSGDFDSATLGPSETQAALNYPAYWAFCWASGQALARYLLDHPERVRGKIVLDFGSGSGVAAIAAAKAGAARVIACDSDPDARLATQINAKHNGVAVESIADFARCDLPLDCILASDVLYDADNRRWLAQFLRRASQVVIADSRVRDLQEEGYRALARAQATTWPDLGEFEEFRQVQLYEGRS